MKNDIKKAQWYGLINMVPYNQVLDILETEYGKREAKYLRDFMAGQTMGLIGEEPMIYVVDLMSFIDYRKKGLTGKNMPLKD